MQVSKAAPATQAGVCALSLSAALLFAAAPALAQPQPTSQGADFIAEAKLLYRVVACGGDEAVPAHLDKKTVDEHCKQLEPKKKAYREKYVVGARKFIGELRPANLPAKVVYPFGGGDLLSALTSFPDATEYTTLSLEHAGDPRRLDKIDKKRLAESLTLFRKAVWGLLNADNSTTENLQKMQRGEIPGELAFFLTALAVYDYEPVSLKFFKLDENGDPHYLSLEEIAAVENEKAKTLRGRWESPDTSVAFSWAELGFRKRGDPNAPLKVHRHGGADLSNAGLNPHPEILKHLEKKGRVAAMTKAASYLLWRDDFSMIRDYLLKNMDWMISDSTGIPPRFATAAGFAQDTFGEFTGSFLGANDKDNKDFRKLWKENPKKALPFRYGYVDDGGHNHMLVTRPARAAPEK